MRLSSGCHDTEAVSRTYYIIDCVSKEIICTFFYIFVQICANLSHTAVWVAQSMLTPVLIPSSR